MCKVIKVNTVYGDSVYVSQEELGTKRRLLFVRNAKGEKLYEPVPSHQRHQLVHRENLVVGAPFSRSRFESYVRAYGAKPSEEAIAYAEKHYVDESSYSALAVAAIDNILNIA